MSYFPIKNIHDDLIPSLKYLHEKTNCIITFENFNQIDSRGKYDKFAIKLQYANIFIKTAVCYDSNDLKLPPDIYFLDQDDFIADLNEIKVLKAWNHTDQRCLFLLLSEIVYTQFKLYNETKLLKFSKKHITNEYIQLKEVYGDDNLEVYVNKGLDYVSINLLINLSQLILNQLDDLNEDIENGTFLTIVNYVHYRDKQQLNLNYELSSDLKNYISHLNPNYDSIMRLPQYDESYTTMKSYSDSVIEIILNFMKSTKQTYTERRLYMNELKEVFKSAIVEYDAKCFSYAAILIAHEDFYCLLKVKLNDAFPVEKPLLTFYSIYHVSYNRLPYKQIIDDYSYKSSWTCNEMIKSLKESLLIMVKRFKESSIKEGKINI